MRRQMVGFKQRLAERIVDARESKGWDQRELAFRARVSDKTVQRLEQGKVDAPRPSTLRKIAEATDREVADLRPDMETEEKNLRAQLNAIERKLDLLLSRLDISEDPAVAVAPPPELVRRLEVEDPSHAEPQPGRSRSGSAEPKPRA